MACLTYILLHLGPLDICLTCGRPPLRFLHSGHAGARLEKGRGTRVPKGGCRCPRERRTFFSALASVAPSRAHRLRHKGWVGQPRPGLRAAARGVRRSQNAGGLLCPSSRLGGSPWCITICRHQLPGGGEAVHHGREPGVSLPKDEAQARHAFHRNAAPTSGRRHRRRCPRSPSAGRRH